MNNQVIFQNKKNALGAVLGVLLIFGIFALLIYQASPGPNNQEILGLGIGLWQNEDGIAFASGRRLDCRDLAETADFNQHCTIMINNKPLEVMASRSTTAMQLSGECTAVYDGETLGCELGSRHVHVHWFAYVDQPMQLDSAGMQAIRTRFYLDNRSEEFFIRGAFILAALTAVVGLWNGAVWIRPYTRNRLLAFFGATIPATVFFFIGFLSTLFLTRNFWD